MKVAGAFIGKHGDEILGLRALGFEEDEQMTPMLDHQPSVQVSQCLVRRLLKLALYPVAVTGSTVTTVRHLRSAEDSSTPASS